VLFGAIFFLCDFFSSVPGMSGRPELFEWPPASNRSHRAATEGNQVLSKAALSKSASLPAQPLEASDPPLNDAAAPAWKQEVNERLAAHRNRRSGPQDAGKSPAAENPRATSARASEAAARVAARYAKAPSYSALLAGEARAVVRAAGAAAEAARNAQAAAEAVLAGLESGPIASGFWEAEPQNSRRESNTTVPENLPSASAAPRWQDEPPAPSALAMHTSALTPWAGAQPRWEEALPVTAPAPPAGRDIWSEMRVHPSTESEYRQHTERPYAQGYGNGVAEGDLFSIEGSESFDSHDPMSSATVEPVQHLPANLIEFPRELVATRKVRPRLAEGPFYNHSHENSQLSIFEVDPDLLVPPADASPSAADEVAPPEWASIELEHLEQDPGLHHAGGRIFAEHVYATEIPAAYASGNEMAASAIDELPVAAVSVSAAKAEAQKEQRRSSVPTSAQAVDSAPAAELLVARLSDRLLAAVVDGALVTLAVVTAAVVVIASTSHPPTGRIALIASGCGLFFFGLLYQFLFLSYAEEGTLGMRYARIALCTFDDDNPTLDQMRQRIPALLLAALPAGLGLLWALFDKDHLGWHDRMTRTYQRKY
jgi:uncharacterized RDD family membrane protein YckC